MVADLDVEMLVDVFEQVAKAVCSISSSTSDGDYFQFFLQKAQKVQQNFHHYYYFGLVS